MTNDPTFPPGDPRATNDPLRTRDESARDGRAPADPAQPTTLDANARARTADGTVSPIGRRAGEGVPMVGDHVKFVDGAGDEYDGTIVHVHNPPTLIDIEYTPKQVQTAVAKVVGALLPRQSKGPGWRGLTETSGLRRMPAGTGVETDYHPAENRGPEGPTVPADRRTADGALRPAPAGDRRAAPSSAPSAAPSTSKGIVGGVVK